MKMPHTTEDVKWESESSKCQEEKQYGEGRIRYNRIKKDTG